MRFYCADIFQISSLSSPISSKDLISTMFSKSSFSCSPLIESSIRLNIESIPLILVTLLT